MDHAYQHSIPVAVLGLSHHTANVEIREKVSLDEEECTLITRRFMSRYPDSGVIVLSTCNRTEFYLSGKDAIGHIPELCNELNDLKQENIFCNNEISYIHYGTQAANHFFRVIAGLDSQMIGEQQITGQVKNAYEKSLALNSTDTLLNKLYHFAMQSEKDVRNKTYLTDGAVSIAFAGVELARKIFSTLQNKTVLLIGAGETAELVALHFLKRDVKKIIVANRTLAKAETLAGKFNGQAVEMQHLAEALNNSDIVISATSGKNYVVGTDILKDVVRRRDHKPLFCIDLAIPRDIDPRSKNLDGIYLFDLDSLNNIVENNISKRKAEIPRAEKIIQNHVGAFVQWYKDLPVTSTITKLSSFFEEIREKEFQRLKKRFPEENHDEVEYLTKSLMKKYLHIHIKTLRNNHQSRQKQHIELLSDIYQENGNSFKNENQD